MRSTNLAVLQSSKFRGQHNSRDTLLIYPNRRYRKIIFLNDAQIKYSRDLRNRLTKVLYPGGDHKKFDYDITGRMIRMAHGDVLEVRHYDSRGQQL